MNVKQYTDKNYIPLSELLTLDNDFWKRTKEYRKEFLEIIKINGLRFVNIIETPSLIKKRFLKNIELKGNFDSKFESKDYILEIAKEIIKNNFDSDFLPREELLKIKELYLKNDNDLTILTSYIVDNYDKLFFKKNKLTSNDIKKMIPELNLSEINFIMKFNNEKLSYSIKDFIGENKSSYETGRKSLDKLVKMELYKKKKIGKQFIYIPTKKVKEIMKEGK